MISQIDFETLQERYNKLHEMELVTEQRVIVLRKVKGSLESDIRNLLKNKEDQILKNKDLVLESVVLKESVVTDKKYKLAELAPLEERLSEIKKELKTTQELTEASNIEKSKLETSIEELGSSNKKLRDEHHDLTNNIKELRSKLDKAQSLLNQC